jgi:two-component system, NarL family, response regulator YdfI
VIRVSVRSASPFARAGIENALAADPRFEIVAEPGSSYESGESVDVILIDASEADVPMLPALSGDSPARFVLLTDAVTRTDFARLLPLGVRAILPRDSSPVEIAATLEAVARDLAVVTPDFLETLLPASPGLREQEPDYLEEPLTARETEVLALLAEGAGNKEIASRLKISENTAKFHVSSILGKLGATTRTEAVTRGYRRGLILI